ncbi:MAG: aminodeoxychorismate synthase component I [bacterium]|nr:aminodeoxychorismate synthase component I [bacterium]
MLNSFSLKAASPVIKRIPFIDPAHVFPAFNDQSGQKYLFFLDSGMNRYGLGRYSFIGLDPFLIFKSKGENIEVLTIGMNGSSSMQLQGNPFTILRQIVDQYKLSMPDMLSQLPSFLGGGVGYFSYEMRNLIEELPAKAMDDLNIPDCMVCLYDVILIFDHKQRQAYISSSGFPEQGSLRHKRALCRIGWVKDRLQLAEVFSVKGSIANNLVVERNRNGISVKSIPTQSLLQLPEVLLPNEGALLPEGLTLPEWLTLATTITSNFTREEYIQAVARVKEYIASGDIYQVNLAQRIMNSISVPPFELYQQLRKINPAPFGSYLDFDEVVIAGSSPERFIMVESGYVETRPIKGTRPRGKNRAEDKRFKEELLLSEKDKAELIMIVDLLRNDLGRVCQHGSVVVKDMRMIETYPTVFHTVATICGKLSPGNDRFDLLKACFPGGSITGAPKIRAMEIIDELEPNKRHIYTGSIGYLSFTGSMDLNIAIRTFLIKNNQVYFHVGGGIIADSLPEDEYLETLHKGKALIEALTLIR